MMTTWSRRRNIARLALQRLETRATPATFTGGTAVAAGDIDGDTYGDIITGAGPVGGPHVKVFSGRTGEVIRDFFAYDPAFTGGLSVASGDVDADGYDDIVTGSGPGGGSHVRVFSGRTGEVLHEFLTYGILFRGGVQVAAGDVDGDRRAEVITAPGEGEAAVIEIHNFTNSQWVVRRIDALPTGFLGGASVGAGDLTGDGKADIVVGAGSGAVPLVEIYDGPTGERLRSFTAFDASVRGGVRVAVGKVSGSPEVDVLVAAGPGSAPRVGMYSPRGDEVRSFLAYGEQFTGGVFVAAAPFTAEGPGEILTGAGFGGGPHVKAKF